MKTGVYQTNISHPGKATEGGWDIFFLEDISIDERQQLLDEHWHLWSGFSGFRSVWIRPLGIRQPWIDNGDGTFTLVEPASPPNNEPDPEPYFRDGSSVPPEEIPETSEHLQVEPATR